jgi:5-methylcytosine-specific restriction endonuclease McrA
MRRVRAARACRRFPSIGRMLAKGELNLVSVSLIEPLLTSENHECLVRKAARRSTREVERMVAELSPLAAGPRDRMRFLPGPETALDPISKAQPQPDAGLLPLRPEGAADGQRPVLASPADTSPVDLASPVETLPAVLALPADPSPANLAPSANPASSPSSRIPTPDEDRLGPQPRSPASRRVAFTFTADEQVRTWFETARDLLRHRFPGGKMEEIIGEALRRLIEETLRSKAGLKKGRRRPEKASGTCGHSSSSKSNNPSKPSSLSEPSSSGESNSSSIPSSPSNPSSPSKPIRSRDPRGSRRIPARVRREVWRRDGGCCAFTGPDGTRCDETAWLEWDHIVPWALGGRSDDPANVRLLCRRHNQTAAKEVFGPRTPENAPNPRTAENAAPGPRAMEKFPPTPQASEKAPSRT